MTNIDGKKLYRGLIYTECYLREQQTDNRQAVPDEDGRMMYMDQTTCTLNVDQNGITHRNHDNVIDWGVHNFTIVSIQADR